MLGLTPGDHRLDAAFPNQAAVLVMVVAAIGEQRLWPSSWPPDTAADGRHPIEKVEQLRDVVAVPAGERPGKGDPAAVYEEMVLATCPAAVNWAGTRFGAPLAECDSSCQVRWWAAPCGWSDGCCARVQP